MQYLRILRKSSERKKFRLTFARTVNFKATRTALLEDNIRQRASDEMDPPTISQAASEDDRQPYLKALSTIKDLRAEVKIVRAQLAQATTSIAPAVYGNVSPVVLTPTENVKSSGRSPTQFSATADGTIAGSTDGSPTASGSRARYDSGLNGSAHIPPPCAASDGTPSMAAILGMIATTQAQLSTALTRNPAATAPVQIHSTSDTSSAIPLYDRTPQQSVHGWISQVERIEALAHWTESLTLASAATRLTGAARDWNSFYGTRCDTWPEWK
ncbi:hypothetical protein V5799_005074 [Amblyomma americanum]|uniref:Uncharacterized protein n=1 Tax=Amblyomma americanum TaxID=6943 RepID=A0AAQ4E0A3_AMBAM